MFHLVETIRIENGRPVNLEYHNRRMAAAISDLFGIRGKRDLMEILEIPDEYKKGIIRCRVIYHTEVTGVEYHRYAIRPVRSLKVLEDNNIDYRYKYTDRTRIVGLFNRRGSCDDILIIKNGFVTDTSYSNIVLRKKEGAWITPATYLLKGTRREFLLKTGIITEEEVTIDNLWDYSETRLINAMIGIEDSESVLPHNILS